LQTAKLYVIRHGETAWSLTGQHTGVTDLALTPHGEDQARTLAPRLAGLDFARVLTSPRLRARQTCVLAGLDAASEVEADLAEWNYGRHEGRRSADIRQEHPDWNVWRDGCPGGESPADVSARADRVIARLAQASGNIAVFSHGHFSTALAVRWIGLPLLDGQHFTLHTASLSILGHNAHRPGVRVIEQWNEIAASRHERRRSA